MKNGPKWQKILSIAHSISQEPCIIWLSFMGHMCKVIKPPGGFFIFSNFNFLGWLGGKSANMVQNYKKSCPLHSISEEPWLIYVCKMIISSVVLNFFFLKILIFLVHRRVKGQKRVQNDKKLCLSCSISQEPCIIWLSFMV